MAGNHNTAGRWDSVKAAILACIAAEPHPGGVKGLAEAAGVSRYTVARLLKGKDIRLSAADSLARYLGLHVVRDGEHTQSESVGA
ncbi:MAG: hypothetical protein Kow0040_01940 [Thermogutta sp.]